MKPAGKQIKKKNLVVSSYFTTKLRYLCMLRVNSVVKVSRVYSESCSDVIRAEAVISQNDQHTEKRIAQLKIW